ncbi:MAG: ribose 5-phosphate isomerase B [Oscillospiraceae bacterium]|nr:ribose 5-phosphate isomerase B [Oscillospiraceae bacterium]
MKVALGADSAGFAMKEKIIAHLNERGIETLDCGAHNAESSHYPEFAYKVATSVSENKADFGILVCGTGIGMSIAANKVKGVRASVCSEHFSAKYTRLHNDANVLCLGARVIGEGLALELCDIFIDTLPEGGRHAARVDMIREIEAGTYTI